MTGATAAVVLCAAALIWVGAALYRQRQRNAGLAAQLEASARALQDLQTACSRLAPAGVVEKLITDGLRAGDVPSAERKVATALFVDLIGYTALSERLDPPTLAGVLNGYFQRVSDAVHEHRGHVSTYLGDGILAYFGAMQPNPWQCDDAVRAAMQMRTAMRQYSSELERDGLPPLSVGIGIHRGPGLAGLVGSRDRMEYMFVGPTVNLAARVQSLTRTLQVDILVTEAIRSELDPGFPLRPMPAEKVKGIDAPVVTYAVGEDLRAASTAG